MFFPFAVEEYIGTDHFPFRLWTLEYYSDLPIKYPFMGLTPQVTPKLLYSAIIHIIPYKL